MHKSPDISDCFGDSEACNACLLYTSCRFAISCGIGFDAAVCHEINRSPLKKFMNRIHLGKFAYLLIGLKQLLLLPPVGISIETENGEKHFYEKVFLTAVMNHKYEGGGFRFCPEADSHDGFLDVILSLIHI